jgi:hypothetical protein
MEVFLSPKIPKKFGCKSCHYYTCNKKDYDKHLLTSKHQKVTNGNNLEEMEVAKILTYTCECSKIFKTHGGLWKHKKKCGEDNETNSQDAGASDVKLLTNMVLEVVKQNQELMNQNQELQKHMIELCKNGTNSKIKKAIKRVASKNQRLLPKFKEAHPDCGTYHSKYSDQYNKIIIESVGGSGDNDAEKEEKIIRNISKNVIVDK